MILFKIKGKLDYIFFILSREDALKVIDIVKEIISD